MNALRKETTVVIELPVLAYELKAPVKKLRLRPWVKSTILALCLGVVSTAGALAIKATSQDELVNKVTWVDAYAHDGDGYERLVRRVNGTKDLDIKAMSSIMQDKNHGIDIQAGQVVQVPVLEGK